MFDGDNSTAHLHRYNHTVYLHLNNGNKTTYYQTDIENMLKFSWIGFRVNGTEMKKVKSNGDFSMSFNIFTFISPIENYSCSDIQSEEKLLNYINSKNTNYGYVIGIVLFVAIIFDAKPKMWKLMREVFKKVDGNGNDNAYETMERIESVI